MSRKLDPAKSSRIFSGITWPRISFNRLIFFIFLSAIIIYLWLRLANAGFHYEWQWNRVWRHFGYISRGHFVPGPLCKGILLTCQITLAGMALSLIFGLLTAILRLSPWNFCNFLAKSYIVIWRGTPLLLQLFFAYFLVSPLLGINPFWTAALSLAAFEGAYLAEIFRAGLLSISRTQWEASLSLGFNLPQTLFYVILPQAWANVLPSFTNQAISVLKDSSLVSAIAVADLTMQSQAIIAETFLAFEVWICAGAIYLVLALFISMPSMYIEHARKWKKL